MKYKLGFIGAGNMAEAIMSSAISADVLQAGQIIASDLSEEKRSALHNKLGVTMTPANSEVITQSEQVLLAIKPQQMQAVANDLAKHVLDSQIIISIMAGITTQKLAGAIGKKARIVRVMPNTPVMVGAGMAGIALSSAAKKGDDDLAMKLFSAGGKAVRVSEDKLDAITAVSGSGPAYLFYLAQAMQKAADELGLTEHSALLVEQTVLGAAKLLVESKDTAEILCQKVKSPGGTTQAALEVLDEKNVSSAVVQAIKAASARSVELGK